MTTAGPVSRRSARAQAERQRQQRRYWLIGGSVLALVVVIIIASLVAKTSTAGACTLDTGISCGSAAPDFTLAQVPGGKKISLSDYKGSPVLLEFFATWCPHCQRMAPVLENLDTANKSKGLKLLSVLADPKDHTAEGNANPGKTSVSDVQWFVNTFNVKHPVLYDPNVGNVATAQASIYKVAGYPTFYLVDKSGVIRWSASGEVTQSELQTQVDKVL